MLEPKTKEIDGHKITYMPMMATPARKILVQLINRFGGSVASGLEGLSDTEFTGASGDQDVTELFGKMGNALAGVVRQVALNLDPSYYEDLVNQFGRQSTIEINDEARPRTPQLTKDLRDQVFATSLLTEAKWIGFCLEVQYSDFFGLVKTASQSAIALKAMGDQSRSGSQKDSTGKYNE